MDFEAVCTPTWADVDRYKRLRRLGRGLNQRIVETIPREMIPRVADALGILHKGVMVFETEDSAGVLMDSCLYDWPVEGKNLVERYAETHTFPAGSDEHELLEASLRAEYRLLVPEAVREGVGVYFLDAFSGDPFFVMDMGLGQSCGIDPNVLFASRIVPFGGLLDDRRRGASPRARGAPNPRPVPGSRRRVGRRQDHRPPPAGAHGDADMPESRGGGAGAV